MTSTNSRVEVLLSESTVPVSFQNVDDTNLWRAALWEYVNPKRTPNMDENKDLYNKENTSTDIDTFSFAQIKAIPWAFQN